MTEKIYYDDPHISRFTARVTECAPEGENYGIVLDRTAFFPEEGGQCCDKGTLAGMEVLHVSIKNGIIKHICKDPLAPGSEVEGEIDHALRFDKEQQHSGEHILSGLANSLYGCTNVGFRLASDITTLDFDKPLSPKEIADLEKKANEVVYRNLPVKCWFPPADELEKMEYRSKIELTEDVRIVEIPGVDTCACCAPHVDFTGQIGVIKVIRHEAWKGGVRLTILCGNRAFEHFSKALTTLDTLTKLCSAGLDSICDAVKDIKDKQVKAEAEKNKAETLLLEARIRQAAEGTAASPIVIFTPSCDTRNVRNAINNANSSDRLCAVFAGAEGSYNFIVECKKGGLKTVLENLRKTLNAKCGGSDTMLQGTITAEPKAILELFKD
ncbi:MAG: alanyl-tRNA editing protein [Lachnospiraceae bacterium]|nr:alanyl-tRNA editing protein [Lachnospiraceae bacterium]